MSDHTGVDGEGQGAPSGTGSQASPGTPTGSRPEGFDPSRKWRRLTEAEGLALWLQGGEAIGALCSRAAWGRKTGYDSEGTSGLLEMVATGLQTEPPAQAMEAHRAETRQRLGAKPDSAVDEASSKVEAPYNTLDHLLSLKAEIQSLTTALAESERKRVEAEARNTAFASLMRVVRDYVIDPSVRATIDDLLGVNAVLATPTQEIPYVES